MPEQQDDDVAFIQALAELLRRNELTELEVSRDDGDDKGLTVRIARDLRASVAAAPAPVALAAAPAAAPAAALAPTAASAEDPAQNPNAVTSPMVGTVYLSPEPGAPAFIKTGDEVAEGQTLLIVEAMKTMNQIPSPRAGRVARILVDDKQAVEFGAPLVVIE